MGGYKDSFNTECLLLILIYITELWVNLSRIISLIPGTPEAAGGNSSRARPEDKLLVLHLCDLSS
jgi:hypothetical protein